MVHSVANCRIVSYVFARGLLPVMLSLALVLGPDLGLEDYVPVNSTDYRV